MCCCTVGCWRRLCGTWKRTLRSSWRQVWGMEGYQWCGMARHQVAYECGLMAWHGMAWQRGACSYRGWVSAPASQQGLALHVVAWLQQARHGMAWRGIGMACPCTEAAFAGMHLHLWPAPSRLLAPTLPLSPGYPFDVPAEGADLLSYCALSYHLPLVVPFSVKVRCAAPRYVPCCVLCAARCCAACPLRHAVPCTFTLPPVWLGQSCTASRPAVQGFYEWFAAALLMPRPQALL